MIQVHTHFLLIFLKFFLETFIETLVPCQNSPHLSGILSILAYLENHNSSFIDKLYWTSFGMIEHTTTKSVFLFRFFLLRFIYLYFKGPVASIKVIRNKSFKKLDKLLLKTHYLSGVIIIYPHFFKNLIKK